MKKRKMLLGSSNYWQLCNTTVEVEHNVVKQCNMLKLNPELVSNGGSSIIISVGSSKKQQVIVKLNPELVRSVCSSKKQQVIVNLSPES
ncbi:hypothetical protein PFBG_02742 [Plasmodium falciparum 7G8]|uniref:Uncharacterized protein n=1 Tax=Plasmodium falciparum (isolate 7G8) TaxID=57266 RepID=W7FMG1_PLAF8|nr:hypothetical protein PFBG_02742 [Plasmodium falciparum 7G8]